MWNNYLNKIKTASSAFLCVCLLAGSIAMAPIDQHGEVLEAQAIAGIGDIVYDPKNAVFNSMQAALQDYFYIKEFTLDGVASGLAKLILKSMTQSILTWINSGFQGSPAFVTDLEQFLIDRADKVAGDFIYGSELGFLCSPFALDVKIALATTYQESAHGETTAQCTLSEVTDNVEGFLNGSFANGGWESWFEVTQNQVNTPTGAYLTAKDELEARIVDEEGRAIKELDWGNGFLSFKVCSDTQVANGTQENCTITTPGKVIEDALTVNLQSGTQSLIEADEINEIIGALFSQLAKEAITGVNGLLGLGGGTGYSNNSFGDGGGSSYLDALGDEDTIPSGIGNPFINAINLAGEYEKLQNEIINSINGLETRLETAVEDHGQCIDLTMPRALVDIQNKALQDLLKSTSAVLELVSLNHTYTNPTTPQEKSEALSRYQQMSDEGLIMNSAILNETRFYIDYDVTPFVSLFSAQLGNAIESCEDDDWQG